MFLFFTVPAQAQSPLERAISLATGGTVVLSGLSGALGSTPHADRLQLKDNDGVWLEIQDVSLTWTRLALFSKDLRIDKVSADRAIVTRLPKSTGPSTGPPELPLRLTIGQLAITRLVVAAPVAGTAVAVSVQGNGAWDGAQTGNVHASLHRLDAEGAYTLEGEASPTHLEATLSIQEPTDGLIAGLAGVPTLGALTITTITATLNGTLAAAAFDITATAAALGPTPIHLAGTATHAPDGALALHLDHATYRSAQATANLTLPPNATLPTGEFNLQLPNLTELRPDLSGTLAAHLALDAAQNLSGDIEATGLPQLDHIRADLTGTVAHPAIHATASGPQAALDLKASLDSTASRLTLETLAAHYQGQTLTLRAPARINFADGIALDHLPLDIRGGTLDIAGRLTPTLDVTATLHDLPASLADLARPDLHVEGTVAGTLRLTGDPTRPTGEVHLAATGLHRLGDPLPPANATVDATFADGQAHTTAQLHLGAAQADIAGTIPLDTAGAMDVTATLHDLPASLAGLAIPGLRLEGTAGADLHLTGTPTAPEGKIHLTATGLRRQGDPIPPATVTLDATIANNQANLTAQARLAAARADLAGTIPLDSTGAMDITATLRDLPAALAAIAVPGLRLEGKIAADIHLTGAPTSPAGKIRLTATGLHRTGDPLPPASASIDATLADGSARLNAQLRLAAAQADVTGTVPLDTSGALDLNATLRNLPASLAAIAAPGLQLQGTIAGDLRLTGPVTRPDGRIRLNATGLRLTNGAWPAATATLDATIAGGAAKLTAQARMGAAQANLSGTLPLDPAGTMNLRATAQADLAMLDPVLTAAGRRARGAVRVDATIGGRLTAPRADGTATLQNGSFEDAVLGARLTAIQLRARAAGDTVLIDDFTARASAGTIAAHGQVGLTPGLPLNLTLTARKAAPLTGDSLSATIDADLTVTGNALATPALSGHIGIEQAEIRVPERLPVQVVVLNVRRPGAKPAPAPIAADIALDLTVEAPGRVFVRGRGIDAELGGKVHVTGTSSAPLFDGRFKLQRGEMKLLGRPLVFTDGTIGLDGNGKLDPSINFTATSQGVAGTTTLTISGTASAPKFTLSAVPPLPQDEAMAQLLFGQNVSQLSTIQLAQVAAGLAQLAGIGSGFDPLDKIRQNLGLDRLSVGTGAGGRGTQIEAGRDIAPGIYLGARQSASGAGTQATVQFDLGHGFKLHADVGTESSSALPPGTTESNGSGVGISWQHEY